MSEKINLKRGDTLELTIQYLDYLDKPVDISNFNIKCQGRLGESLIFNKSLNNGIIITDGVNGRYTIYIDVTDDFPIGVIKSDIKYIDNNNIKSTNTFNVIVEENITR